ncbi:Outer membrane porin F precursor [compost metagenome]
MKLLLHSLFILSPILSFTQVKPAADSLSFYFESGSHQINFQNKSNSEAKNNLSKLKGQLLILRAYTDSVGSKESNIKLAQRRLETTRKYLTESFPDQFSIQTKVALGEDQASRNDKDKRRVDILISGSQANTQTGKKKRTFELGVPIRLEIQFVFGQDVVIASSYEDIRFLMETLQADKTLFVTLAGHVCCGSDSKNLSGKRADRIKQILVMEGNISGSRINTIGFGNKKPLFVEDSEEHRQANRRVEATFYKK